MDVALNNQQWLMCHKTKPNQIKSTKIYTRPKFIIQKHKFNYEAPVMLELWGVRSISLLPSPPGLLCPGVVARNMGQIELNFMLMLK